LQRIRFFNKLANSFILKINVLKKIRTALISVYYKQGIDEIVAKLHENKVKIFSTGGTYDFISSLGFPVEKVETLTGYPSILGGRVKTLHPKVLGGILGRSSVESDRQEMEKYQIPSFDLVIVDLYPFEETVQNTSDEEEIIEKIDIGGISLIRAAAKNFEEVLIVPSSNYYSNLIQLLNDGQASSTISDRRKFAGYAFGISSHYDAAIYHWFTNENENLRLSKNQRTSLRYGENPHQKGIFHGDLSKLFEQLHGKELSYNNLLDLDAGLNLLNEFNETTFAILKHNNACGIASRNNLTEAYLAALAGDPVSAFGGVLVSNTVIDLQTAEEINKLFFEIIIAPDYKENALQLLISRKNRIILRSRAVVFPDKQYRSILNGILEQERDLHTEQYEDFKIVTNTNPSENEIVDLIYANKIVKHTRSNAIVLVKDKQLMASGIGQTSRVDSLKQAIVKAAEYGFDLHGAVMASDAFFPFADSVEIAANAGIRAVVQPGGSVRDQETIDFCNSASIGMVFTGTRHFKH
jgi:phosphoribosylaminoimidazolecarboxamide formyltransferase/IMP cyclohydrolase